MQGIRYREARRKEAVSYTHLDVYKRQVFNRLLEAVNRLMRVARGCEGMANKELAKFESQINHLADEWER